MRKTKRIGDTRYVFSSEGDLKVGDEVFPIYYNGEWDWVNITGFPDKPQYLTKKYFLRIIQVVKDQ